MPSVNLKDTTNPLLLHYIRKDIYSEYGEYMTFLNCNEVSLVFNDHTAIMTIPTTVYVTEQRSKKIIPYLIKRYAHR